LAVWAFRKQNVRILALHMDISLPDIYTADAASTLASTHFGQNRLPVSEASVIEGPRNRRSISIF